jgi:hypothetical protein
MHVYKKKKKKISRVNADVLFTSNIFKHAQQIRTQLFWFILIVQRFFYFFYYLLFVCVFFELVIDNNV